MDWDQRSKQNSFFKSYMDYLSKAKDKISDDKKQQLKEPLQLTPFEKMAVVSVLKQTIAKISVINNVFDSKHKLVELPPPKPPMEVRFNKDQIEKLYDEQTLQPLRECYKAMSENKLKNDIELIRCALEICVKEIEETGKFDRFAEFIFSENREAHDEYSLLAKYDTNLQELEELQKHSKQKRAENDALLFQLDEDLFNLKTECEDKRELHKLEIKMIEKWESARQEQVEAIFNHELKNLNQSRDDYEEKTERELIAINEIMAFYRAKCTKLECLIEQWQRRFEDERKVLDERIKHTQENIDDVRSKHQMIQKWYKEREQFIENYYIEQQRKEECRRLEQEKRSAAIRIQAWWRGTMVRKQLGPYRPKKKSKKPKVSKKK